MNEFENDSILRKSDPILVTGAAGFIGSRFVNTLLEHGFRNLRCFVRQSSDTSRLEIVARSHGIGLEELAIFRGNLLSREDCLAATRNVRVIFHLAAGGSATSYPDAFMNSVVTTRNLLDATLQHKCLMRFVNISSLAVYTNTQTPRWRLLDESCAVESRPELRGDAYCFAKIKQDEIVEEYGDTFGIPYVIVRPGYVYGPGKDAMSSRVGIGTFGVFLHLGGSNRIPFTYVDNCAEAILMAGMKEGIDGQAFNIVDDDLPSSRNLLRLYKRNVRRFRSVYIPHSVSYLLCSLWECYALWSEGQLPPVFNRKRWHAYWKKTRYSNGKAKAVLGWTPSVPTAEGFARYFRSVADGGSHA